MTSDFFRKFLTTLNQKMVAKNRNLLLFVNQCSAHPKDLKFKNAAIGFLPANTTTRLQPLDVRIIQNVKHHFKRLLPAKIERKDEILNIVCWTRYILLLYLS